MIANARNDIQEFELSSAYDEVFTDSLLLSIFREMVQAATSSYVLKKGLLQNSFLEPVYLSTANESKYFKIARQGEALILSFNSFENAAFITKHYSPSRIETPQRLRKVAIEVGALMAQQEREPPLISAAIFLHDLQGVLYLHLGD